jgi:hypothetical protein
MDPLRIPFGACVLACDGRKAMLPHNAGEPITRLFVVAPPRMLADLRKMMPQGSRQSPSQRDQKTSRRQQRRCHLIPEARNDARSQPFPVLVMWRLQ